jgi:ABC-2 type transport system permease protein
VNRLIHGELIKVRTTRTALGFAVASVLLVLALVLISFLAGNPDSVQDKRDAMNVGGVLSVPLLIFGIVGATGEYRHRTIAPAVLIAPGRARLTVARLIAYLLTALGVGVAMVVVAIALGTALGGGGEDLAGSDYATIAGGGLIVAVLSTALGVGVGVLVGAGRDRSGRVGGRALRRRPARRAPPRRRLTTAACRPDRAAQAGGRMADQGVES